MGETGRIRAERRPGVFLLAENRLLRETLSRLLAKKCEVSIVGQRASGDTVVEDVVASGCEILLLDYFTTTVTHLNLVSRILEQVPELKVVLIGMESDEHTFLRAVCSGAVGYVPKDASAMDIVTAVRAVACGEAFCPPKLCLSLFRYVARQSRDVPSRRARVELGLTRRQQQLVSLVARGLTNKEIANNLNLSEQTVKNHIHRILRQVNAESRYEAVDAIRACGILV